ncbi:MAG: sulfite exporter TauE/SafE family protein [Rhodoferax sp.]|nr:sulfite exporter TauE/SafE family protein [Rhodoferax sp.]
MQSSLALTALFMGLAGGPHCVAMCGAPCAGIVQASGARKGMALWAFQIGRISGYSLMGGLAAASLQGLGWLTVQSAALRPVWSLFHIVAITLGLVLLLQARQPVLLENAARAVWAKARSLAARGGAGSPLVFGVVWALLPCGLLYSALLVAALAQSISAGAAVMALFAVGTSLSMLLGPWLWLRLWGSSRGQGSGTWGMRLAGAALAVSSGWALWMALAHNTAPWCQTP